MKFNYMNRSSAGGIFLGIVMLLSVTLVMLPPSVYADEISVTSIALEETSLLELTNDSTEEVNTLRIWLGTDFNFKSFKTQEGWTGEKNSEGVIIFTSAESIKPGESVKFGVKTDKPNSGINWKALDGKNTQVDTGISVAEELPPVENNPASNNPDPAESNGNVGNAGESMSSESTFRIVPKEPKIGSTIRVTGDKFGPSQEFDFYIDTQKLGSFQTDQNGHFMTTMKIPDNQNASRVDFKVKDAEGNEKKKSIRIEEGDTRISVDANIPLTVKGVPNIIHRGDFLEPFGTGEPNSAITAEINSPNGEVINSRTAEVDSQGNWKVEEPISVALDAPFGKYSATISDGRENIVIDWTIESDKKIIITPTNLKVNPGEIMKFNGTALPNMPIELVLEDPLGKEITSDIVQVDSSGFVSFEYPTEQSTPEGTYTLVASQEKDTEFIYAGIGQLPTIPANLEFDKLNYKASESAIITLSGKASEIISLLIIDPSDKPKGEAVSITLQPDGRGTHTVDLEGFGSGVYTAVISKGSAQSTEIFTVGLQTGSGEIDINTTKVEYNSGDSILILGETKSSNVLITLTMTDPEGNVIKTKETFSDKNKKISESSFRIPSDGKSGVWTINAKSGSNFDEVEIDVVTSLEEGMVVSVIDGGNIPGTGDTIIIKVFGAQQNVEIEIISAEGETIDMLEGVITSDGIIDQIWPIPSETPPGTYTVKVTNPTDSAETTYEIQ